MNGNASIAYPLAEKNVFIVGKPDVKFLKMVKIRVTGETAFDWLEARYYANYPKDCGVQLTFTENCFQGSSANQEKYNVILSAVKRQTGT